MNFVLVKPQHVNVSNPVTEETIMSQQEEIKHDHFLYRKDMYYIASSYATQGKNKQKQLYT